MLPCLQQAIIARSGHELRLGQLCGAGAVNRVIPPQAKLVRQRSGPSDNLVIDLNDVHLLPEVVKKAARAGVHFDTETVHAMRLCQSCCCLYMQDATGHERVRVIPETPTRWAAWLCNQQRHQRRCIEVPDHGAGVSDADP